MGGGGGGGGVVDNYLSTERSLYISRMMDNFDNINADDEKKYLGLKTLDISDVRAFLLGGDENRNVNMDEVAKKGGNAKKRLRLWDGKWMLFVKANADKQFVVGSNC